MPHTEKQEKLIKDKGGALHYNAHDKNGKRLDVQGLPTTIRRDDRLTSGIRHSTHDGKMAIDHLTGSKIA